MSWRHKKYAGKYRSGLEADIAKDLQSRGISFYYEHKKFTYNRRVTKGECEACGGSKVFQRRSYTPDFQLGETFIEAKGRFTGADRAKMLAVRESNEGLDIRLIFAANNKIQKNKDARYSDWADKHGFLYTIGRKVPDDWVPDGGGKSGLKRKRVNRKGKQRKDLVPSTTDESTEGGL